MKIQKTITLNIDKVKTNLVCYDLTTLQILMGASSVSGNLHMYGVKKEKGKYVVSINRVKERIQEIKRRINRDTHRCNLMEQIIEN